jgi:hypothetical protein
MYNRELDSSGDMGRVSKKLAIELSWEIGRVSRKPFGVSSREPRDGRLGSKLESEKKVDDRQYVAPMTSAL